MKEIESLEDWLAYAAELAEDGYVLSSWQYDVRETYGFHAWFWLSGRAEKEVRTYCGAVQEAIVRFKAK